MHYVKLFIERGFDSHPECFLLDRYAVPDVPYSIVANVGTNELNALVNTLLRDANAVDGKEPVEFEFLVFGEFLRLRLGNHLRERSISFEDVIQIEYVERFPVPEPQDCLLHDDWVSAVRTYDKWILTGCYDSTVNIWTIDGKHLLTIPGHTAPIKAVTWVSIVDKVATFATASQDQTVMIWKWNIENNAVECIYVCKGHERGIDSLATSPAKKLIASGSWDTMLKIWRVDDEDGDEVASKKTKSDAGETRVSVAGQLSDETNYSN